MNEGRPFKMRIPLFSTESDVSPTRRPTGTRRRQLEWLTNFVLVVVSLFGCSVGAGLLGFYKLHLLQFISIEFVIVPVVLLGARLTLIIAEPYKAPIP